MTTLTGVQSTLPRVTSLAGASRWRAIGTLTRPVLRLVPWWHLLAGALLAAAVVSQARGDEYASVDSITSALRMALVPLVLSAGFVLDDPTEDTLGGTPVTVMARRMLRVGPTVIVLALTWWTLVAWAETAPAMHAMLNQTATGGPPAAEAPAAGAAPTTGWLLPSAALSIEAAALLALALAAAAYGVRFAADRSGGMVAAAAVLAGLVVAYVLPPNWALLVRPSAAPAVWHDAHVRWAWLGALALLLFVQASRDPGRRRLITRLRRDDGGGST